MKQQSLNSKRAFTLTELIIIVAVIGVLATIIIPSFLGTDKKVTLKTDESAVETLNNSLDSAEALKTKLATVSDVRTLFANGGYGDNALQPETEGYAFVWDKSLNAVLMVNLNNDKVTSPERFNDETNDGDWYFINRAPAEANGSDCLYPSVAGLARAAFDELLKAEVPTKDEMLFAKINSVNFTYNGVEYSRDGYVAYAYLTVNGTYEDGTTGPRLGDVTTCQYAQYAEYTGTGSVSAAGKLLQIPKTTNGVGAAIEIVSGIYFTPKGGDGYYTTTDGTLCWRYEAVTNFTPSGTAPGHTEDIR